MFTPEQRPRLTRQYSDEWFAIAWKVFNALLSDFPEAQDIKGDLYLWQAYFNALADQENLTDEQHRKLRRLLDITLARWFTFYVKAILTFGERKAADSTFIRMYGNLIERKLRRIERQRLSANMRHAFLMLTAEQQRAALTSASAVMLPKPEGLNDALQSAFSSLKDDWAIAYEKAAGVEAQYMLAQMATHYLPEAFALYSAATSLPAEQLREAEELVGEQLTLLHQQVKRLANSSDDPLSALRAHTGFIREISQRQSSSALVLRKEEK